MFFQLLLNPLVTNSNTMLNSILALMNMLLLHNYRTSCHLNLSFLFTIPMSKLRSIATPSLTTIMLFFNRNQSLITSSTRFITSAKRQLLLTLLFQLLTLSHCSNQSFEKILHLCFWHIFQDSYRLQRI